MNNKKCLGKVVPYKAYSIEISVSSDNNIEGIIVLRFWVVSVLP